MIETISLILLAVIAVLMIRNGMVYKYRGKLIEAMYSKNRTEISMQKYDKLDERHAAYDVVSYDEMVWKFWRPLHSFYDHEFLRDIGVIE